MICPLNARWRVRVRSERLPGESPTVRPGAARLAVEIRSRRLAAGLSQQQLAVLAGYTRQYVSLAERVGRDIPSLELVRALDHHLDAQGSLLALRRQAVAEQLGRRAAAATAPPDHAEGAGWIDAPAGRYFAGTRIATTAHPATDDGRTVIAVTGRHGQSAELDRPGRGVLVGTLADGDSEPRRFALDRRAARARSRRASDGAPLLIPKAYELDDLGTGLLWAAVNLDDALLDDDSALASAEAQLAGDSGSDRTVGRQESTTDLSTVSRMHLGSTICARHIIRNAGTLASPPTYWTREQRGEEASTWLFLAHKYAYLTRTAALFGSGAAGASRAFCVPRQSIDNSKPAERVLLLLAVGLMESFDLRVDVCSEAEYTALQGFVLDGRRRAIVANWVGQDGIWHIDVTDHKATLREFADARGYATAHSVIAGETPRDRLRAFADYLGLDWSWLTRRCEELGDYGVAGLASPRSRHLSTAGADRACSFIGGLAR